MTSANVRSNGEFDQTMDGSSVPSTQKTNQKATKMLVHAQWQFDENCGCHGCETVRRENSGEGSLGRGLIYGIGLSAVIVLLIVVIVRSL